MSRHAFRIEQLEHRLLLANDPIVVDTAEDRIADDGVTSLREAIIEANARPGADIIQFAEFRRGRPIKFARGGMGENEAATGDLDITDDLTIAGRGAGETIIDANRLDRVFHIHGDITVIISGVTIRGGQIGGGSGSGGGILNQGSLSILESVITDNTASYTGGAIINRGTIKNISQSTISGNTASHAAGAIENSGTIESISQSVISGNTAGHEAGAIENYGVIKSISQTTFSGNTSDSAGAIENYGTITSISQSTFSGNTASRKAGAIENYGSIGNISQTTFSGNAAPGGGSAIENYGSIGSISQSTITGNSLDGGVAVLQHSRGTIDSLENTIIAGNGNESSRYGRRDLSGGGINTAINNLIGASDGHSITNGVDGNIVGVDPKLGPLADHGGPTFTHAPLPGSPAIDAGSFAGGLGFDQRGTPFVRLFGESIDIGALEIQPRIEPIIVDTVRDVMADDGKTSLREAILKANSTVGPGTIMFAESLDGRAITLSILGTDEDATLTGDLDITDDLTIVGRGLENTILNANEIDRVLDIHGDIAVTIFGVTITGGRSNDRGGGISNRGARLTLLESKISGNSAESMGGGINNEGTIGSLYQTTLSDNEARYGGGLGNFGTIESIQQSTFSANTASLYGGAIGNRGTIEQMNQSTISGNSASDGGAIRNSGTIDNISQMTFTGNTSSDDGGAIQNYGTIESISQSTFSGNVASDDGGAIKNYDTIKSISLTTFSGNVAFDDGGAIKNYGSIGNISQTTISGNSAAGVGGAIQNYGSINRISQSTITGNTADRNPGILSSGPIRTLESTIIAGNTDTNGSEGSDLSGGRDITARNNLIGTSSGHTIRNDRAGNIVGVDPMLGPLADNDGVTLTHALLPGSPAIDAGNNRDSFSFDQRGAPFRRIMGQSADVGAFEYVTPIVVDTDLDVIADDGVTSLREAIIEANASIGADAIRFVESSRPKIFEFSIRGIGENAAATGDLDITDDLSIEGHGARKTIIDAAGIDRVFEIHGDIAVTITGVTIRGGQTNGGGGGIRNQDGRLSIYDSAIVQNWAAHAAGGIENFGTIEVISQTSFTDNVAMFGGGVIANEGAIGDITRTTFLRNSSNHSGGAIENFGTIDAIEQTTFSENTSSFGGGAINNFGIMNHLSRTTFSENSANHGGGAIENSGTIGSISLTTISNNTAAHEAGAIENAGVIKSISHSTITGNTAQRGAAILQDSNAIIGQLQNTIIAGNSNGRGSGLDDLENNGTINSSVNNLIGSSLGHTIADGANGNIVGVDPKLSPLADYGGLTLTHALLPDSPAIDAGSNPLMLAFDQRGEPFVREFGRSVDIGAFELQPGPVVVMPFTEQDLRNAMLSIVGEPDYLAGLDLDDSGMIDIRDLQLFRTPQVVSPPDEDPYFDLYALENSKSDTDLRTAHEHVFASIADGELTPLLPLSGLER